MKLSLRLLLLVVVCLLTTVCVSGQLILDPELYFVVDDQATGADNSLRDSIVLRVDSQLNLATLVTNYKVTVDAAVNRAKLNTAMAVVVYQGEVLVIVGANAPPHVVTAAQQISSLIFTDFNIQTQQLSSSAMTSDDLTNHVTLPVSELAFVLEDRPELSDDMVLRLYCGASASNLPVIACNRPSLKSRLVVALVRSAYCGGYYSNTTSSVMVC